MHNLQICAVLFALQFSFSTHVGARQQNELLSERKVNTPSGYYGPCQPPSNKPGTITITKHTATTVEGRFEASQPGNIIATSYLVLISSRDTVPDVQNKSYTAGESVGDATVVGFSADLTFRKEGLNPETKYYVFVFAANVSCFNRDFSKGTAETTKATTQAAGAGDSDKTAKQSSSNKLSALLDFNFAGKQNSWSNLTPAVYYGWTENVRTDIYKRDTAKNKTDVVGFRMSHTFQVGPYVGSTIAIKDSTSYLPALMLPGNAGFQLNYFITFFNEEKFSVVLAPVNFGMKVISGFRDSGLSIVQHSLRHSIGVRWADKFSMSVQYTQGWHTMLSNTEENFHKVFRAADTKVSYWNVTISSRLSEDILGTGKQTAPLYLALSWRSFNKPDGVYKLPNARILTLSLTTDLNLKSGANGGQLPIAGRL